MNHILIFYPSKFFFLWGGGGVRNAFHSLLRADSYCPFFHGPCSNEGGLYKRIDTDSI